MKKKAAVVGYGGMGGWHTRHMLESDVVTLAGIYDIKEDRKEAARANGIHVFETLDEIIADKEIELVTVAVPNDAHEEIVTALLCGGKNVICEKPVALSLESLERMIDAAKANGRIFSVHQNRRFDVDYLAMKALKESGEIGDVVSIESRIHGSRGIPSDWRGEKERGGGMLYDWGVHLIDQILMILGFDTVKSVRCDFEHTTNFEVDDGFFMDITFDGGARAHIETCTFNFIAMPRFYMRATKGSAMIKDWREPAHVVKCKYWHENDVLPVQTAAGLTKTMAPRDSVTVDEYDAPRPESDVHDYYRNFCATIDGKATQLVTHDQMRAVLRVIAAGFESAETGKTVYFK